jgi:hypothetical protein
MHALHLDGLARFAWYCQITFIDLIPKLLAGQFWIWKSYRELFRNREQIKSYRQKLHRLLVANQNPLSIFVVTNRIRESVKNKQLIRIKP